MFDNFSSKYLTVSGSPPELQHFNLERNPLLSKSSRHSLHSSSLPSCPSSRRGERQHHPKEEGQSSRPHHEEEEEVGRAAPHGRAKRKASPPREGGCVNTPNKGKYPPTWVSLTLLSKSCSESDFFSEGSQNFIPQTTSSIADCKSSTHSMIVLRRVATSLVDLPLNTVTQFFEHAPVHTNLSYIHPTTLRASFRRTPLFGWHQAPYPLCVAVLHVFLIFFGLAMHESEAKGPFQLRGGVILLPLFLND